MPVIWSTEPRMSRVPVVWCGYDDFCFLGWFELGGFAPQETEEQMQIFAEDVMPVIARECGGKVELLARGLDLVA